MFYYEVVPTGRQYHSEKYLTYAFDKKLSVGQIVVVTLQTKSITGFVLRSVPKPTFSTKPITRSYDLVVPKELLQLFMWMREYYPYGMGATASLFVPPALEVRTPVNQKANSELKIMENKLPALTASQQAIADKVIGASTQTHIIHGDTGSGKTRVYIEIARRVVASGKSVIVLTPEISLTPQLLQRFGETFSVVHVVHSHLTSSQRRDIWRAIANTKGPQIVIGPRSALFMPINDVGAVIVDEFHESAYKQEQAPRYHALRVAGKLASLCSAKLVLGSATPPVEDYFYATTKGAVLHRLTDIPSGKKSIRTTKIINLSDPEERTNIPLISKSLLAAIEATLERGEQVLIFHNKRGSSRSVLCVSCGWFAVCKRCNIPYTYHGDTHSFLCHTCGQKESTPNNCPECGAADIVFKGPGTKSIAASLAKQFPSATVGRYDKDNTRVETFSANQAKIERGDVDILVGTQLLTKGHDLPKLSLVGVLLAETGLQFPDYNAQEKSYQLLHQVAGRVARGHRGGTVLLQTFNPGQKTLVAAEHKIGAWEDFYRGQLAERKSYGFPPFTYILKIEVAKKSEKNTQKTAEKLSEDIEKNFAGVTLIGLAPSFIPRANDLWRWHIIVSSTSRASLIGILKSLPKNVSYDLEPISLL